MKPYTVAHPAGGGATRRVRLVDHAHSGRLGAEAYRQRVVGRGPAGDPLALPRGPKPRPGERLLLRGRQLLSAVAKVGTFLDEYRDALHARPAYLSFYRRRSAASVVLQPARCGGAKPRSPLASQCSDGLEIGSYFSL
jgi:hypothetical protein